MKKSRLSLFACEILAKCACMYCRWGVRDGKDNQGFEIVTPENIQFRMSNETPSKYASERRDLVPVLCCVD